MDAYDFRESVGVSMVTSDRRERGVAGWQYAIWEIGVDVTWRDGHAVANAWRCRLLCLPCGPALTPTAVPDGGRPRRLTGKRATEERGKFCRSSPRCSADVKTSFLEICSFIARARYVYRQILPGDARRVRYICGWTTEWRCGEQVVSGEQTHSARWPRMHC